MTRPPAVLILLAINILVFALTGLGGMQLVTALGLWPPGSGYFAPWQLLSYGFVHAGLLHLALNMYALWLFGTPLERTLGTSRFVLFYIGSVIGAALLHLLVQALQASQGMPVGPVIGASGGTFGLLLGFAWLFPETRLLLLIPPMPVKAKWFVLGYGALELVFGVTGTVSGVAHFAHLGGMVAAWLMMRRWYPRH